MEVEEKSSVEGEQDESGDELPQQQLKHLEKDRNSFKQSNPDPGRVQGQHCWATPTHTPTPTTSVRSVVVDTLELLEDDTLPIGDLISYSRARRRHPHLPSEGSGGWKVRNNDLVVEEILRERRAAIESGKLKGKRLFDFDFDFDLDALQGSTSDLDMINMRWGEDMCSGCSSVLIQGSEVRSMCSSSSSSSSSSSTATTTTPDHNGNDNDEDEGDHGFRHDDSLGRNFHLSSNSSISPRNKVERDKVVTSTVGEKRHVLRVGHGVDGERGMLLMGCLAIVLMLFALAIISLKSFEGFGDHQSFDTLIPT